MYWVNKGRCDITDVHDEDVHGFTHPFMHTNEDLRVRTDRKIVCIVSKYCNISFEIYKIGKNNKLNQLYPILPRHDP
jgi:hypothetical protein